MFMKSRAFISIMIMLGSFIVAQAQTTTLVTSGPVGSSLTTDNYGVVTSLTIGQDPNKIKWLDYYCFFSIYNGGHPLETNQNNATLWDGVPPAPCQNGFFIPGRFQDWSYDISSTNAWSSVVELENGTVHVIGGIGYRLTDPSPSLGDHYIEMRPASQLTNVGTSAITIKSFCYSRLYPSAPTTILYNTGSDLTAGTSDDYVLAGYNNSYPFFLSAGYPITHYRMQADTSNPTLYSNITNGVTDYDLIDSTKALQDVQAEVAFQYQPVTLQPNQAIIFWQFPKAIKVNNSATNYPTQIDLDTLYIKNARLNTNLVFDNTDVTMNFSAATYANTTTKAGITVVEITGGMITSPMTSPLTNVSAVRYWEIYYDTKRQSSTANITFTYDPTTDGIFNEDTLELAYRSDYDQNWHEYTNVLRNPGANTITARNVTIGDAHWILAATGVNSLPVELAIFTRVYNEPQLKLYWRTETEKNNLGFKIYRAADQNETYQQIGWINGAGTSVAPKEYYFTDISAEVNHSYKYYIESIDHEQSYVKSQVITVVYEQNETELPLTTGLLQNYPNPFNPETWIPFTLDHATDITIQIFNIRGDCVRNFALSNKPAGMYLFKGQAIHWDGTDENGKKVSSGVYYYRIVTDNNIQSKKMILMK
jgi:hypothetical protein